jgi:hypothetical protein
MEGVTPVNETQRLNMAYVHALVQVEIGKVQNDNQRIQAWQTYADVIQRALVRHQKRTRHNKAADDAIADMRQASFLGDNDVPF